MSCCPKVLTIVSVWPSELQVNGAMCTIASQIRVSLTFDLLRSCGPFIQFWSFQELCHLYSHFLVTHGPRPDVWLVSQQLHASRFDMESAIVGYSVIIGRMSVWKRGGCPARGTHCLSSFRPIGDVSKLNTLSQYM